MLKSMCDFIMFVLPYRMIWTRSSEFV